MGYFSCPTISQSKLRQLWRNETVQGYWNGNTPSYATVDMGSANKTRGRIRNFRMRATDAVADKLILH